jgi:hypothetical protein
MTALDSTPAADHATGERRAAARDAYRTSLAEGVPLTGAELGRRFGLSPRWGRLRVAEVHAEAAAAGNGWHPERHVAGEGREHDPTGSQAEHDRGGGHWTSRRTGIGPHRRQPSTPRPAFRIGMATARGCTDAGHAAGPWHHDARCAGGGAGRRHRVVRPPAGPGRAGRRGMARVASTGLGRWARCCRVHVDAGAAPCRPARWGARLDVAARRYRCEPGCQCCCRRSHDGWPGRRGLAAARSPARLGAALAGPSTYSGGPRVMTPCYFRSIIG